MNGYTAIDLPPQVVTAAFVCGRCSAVVLDPARHTDAAHPPATVDVHVAEAAAPVASLPAEPLRGPAKPAP